MVLTRNCHKDLRPSGMCGREPPEAIFPSLPDAEAMATEAVFGLQKCPPSARCEDGDLFSLNCVNSEAEPSSEPT